MATDSKTLPEETNRRGRPRKSGLTPANGTVRVCTTIHAPLWRKLRVLSVRENLSFTTIFNEALSQVVNRYEELNGPDSLLSAGQMTKKGLETLLK